MRTATLRLASSQAKVKPVGPAPTIKTAVLFTAEFWYRSNYDRIDESIQMVSITYLNLAQIRIVVHDGLYFHQLQLTYKYTRQSRKLIKYHTCPDHFGKLRITLPCCQAGLEDY